MASIRQNMVETTMGYFSVNGLFGVTKAWDVMVLVWLGI